MPRPTPDEPALIDPAQHALVVAVASTGTVRIHTRIPNADIAPLLEHVIAHLNNECATTTPEPEQHDTDTTDTAHALGHLGITATDTWTVRSRGHRQPPAHANRHGSTSADEQPHDAYIADVEHALAHLGIDVADAWAHRSRGHLKGTLHIPADQLDDAAARRWPHGFLLKWQQYTGWTWRSYLAVDGAHDQDQPLVADAAASPELVASAGHILVQGGAGLLPLTHLNEVHGEWPGKEALAAACAGNPVLDPAPQHIAKMDYDARWGGFVTCRCGTWEADRTRPLAAQRAAHRLHRAAVEAPPTTTGNPLKAQLAHALDVIEEIKAIVEARNRDVTAGERVDAYPLRRALDRLTAPTRQPAAPRENQ